MNRIYIFTQNKSLLTKISQAVFFVVIILLPSLSSCHKEEIEETNYVPTKVVTSAITAITDVSATFNADFTAPQPRQIVRGLCWSTTQSPTILNNHFAETGSLGVVSYNVINLIASTTYYVRAYTNVSTSETIYGNEVKFTTKAATLSLPTITSSIPIVSSSVVTCGGTITSDGGVTVTSRGVCYSTTANPTISNSISTNGNGIGTFTCSLTSLPASTTYYVRAYATNSMGTAYGNQVSFTTLGATPTISTVSTNSLSTITQTTAVGGGNVTSDGGATVTAKGVCWSTTTNPTITNFTTNEGTFIGAFTSTLTGLLPSTTYYVRAYAINSVGTAYGNIVSFTTSSITATLPLISTASITSKSTTGGVGGGTISSDGGATVTSRGVCYSTVSNPTILNSKTSDGSGIGSFTSSMTGLSASITYYVRAYATNSVGTAYGSQVSFTTDASAVVLAPTITTAVISSVSPTTCIGGGTISSDGGATVTARGVCYNTLSNPTTINNFTSDGTGVGSFNSSIIGLTASTTYYVRAYATNSAGTAYGSQVSFTTTSLISLPIVTTNTISSISQTAAFGGGTATSIGAPITYSGICWSTTSTPTTSNSTSMNSVNSLSFTNNLTALLPNTTYYVRAFATNILGTTYGNQVSFTTAPSTIIVLVPTISTTNVTAVSSTTSLSSTNYFSGGYVSNDGGGSITSRGVCYSTLSSPTTNNNITSDGIGIGSFVSALTGLLSTTTYYARAYAYNSAGVGYGNEVSFTTGVTSPTPGVLTVSTTTSNPGLSTYGTLNVLAIWIEDSNGALVNTMLYNTTNGSSSALDLSTWYAKIGTWANRSAKLTVDGITGATNTSYGVKTATWGSKASVAAVADGVYSIKMEIASDAAPLNSAGHKLVTYTFTKGATSSNGTLVGSAQSCFTGTSVKWTPQ